MYLFVSFRIANSFSRKKSYSLKGVRLVVIVKESLFFLFNCKFDYSIKCTLIKLEISTYVYIGCVCVRATIE